MTMTTILPPASRGPTSGGFRIDPSRGTRSARVSSEWFSRPDDERYLSLSDLHAATLARADRATARRWKAAPFAWKRPATMPSA